MLHAKRYHLISFLHLYTQQTKIQFELLFLLLLDTLEFRYMYLYFEQDAYRYKFDLIGLPLERSERCGFRAGFPKTHIKNRLYRRIISRISFRQFKAVMNFWKLHQCVPFIFCLCTDRTTRAFRKSLIVTETSSNI